MVVFVICVLILLRTRGQFFTSQDNFNHWATVVKTMLLSNKLPSESDIFVNFKTYPLGSSIWIYYVSKIIKNSEGMYMFAKELIILSAILPIMRYMKNNNKVLSFFLYIIFIVFCSTYIIPINNIQVDNLLPLIALSLFIIILNKTNTIFSCFVGIFLTQIKNSGFLFLLIVLILELIINKNKRKDLIVVLASCLAFYILWKIHLNISFQNPEASQQALSLQLFKTNISDKSFSDFLQMLKLWINSIFGLSIYNKCLFYVPLCLSIMSIIINKKDGIRFTLTINVIYFVYAFLTLMMYLFSMPRGEALVLSCFQRYMLSVSEFLLGLFIIYFLYYDSSKIKQLLICLSLVILIYVNPVSLFDVTYDSGCKRVHFAKMLQYYDVKPGKHSLIVDNEGMDEYRTYTYWSMRYDLWSEYFNRINGIDDFEFDDYKLDGYNYLIIITPTDKSNYYLLSHGYEDLVGMEYICIEL